MKTTSAVVRVLQSINGLTIVIGFCGGGICVEAQTNSWTSPMSCNWEDLTWSLGARPTAGQDIFITNSNWKAVQLTHSTPPPHTSRESGVSGHCCGLKLKSALRPSSLTGYTGYHRLRPLIDSA